jgi:hypothetical protein
VTDNRGHWYNMAIEEMMTSPWGEVEENNIKIL